MKNKLIIKFIFLGIFILAAGLRFYGLNWDQGFLLHPDERAIIMFTLPLHFPPTLQQFLSASSPWNPHFFAYGSFPLYLLKLISSTAGYLNIQLAGYGGIGLVGRTISVFFDLGTLICVFLLGRKLKNSSTGLMAASFYAIGVLPIQLSHFYAVDTILTFFLTLTIYVLVNFYERPNFAKAILIGALLGFAFATKISATVIIISLATALTADFALLVLKHPLHPSHWFRHIPIFIFSLIKNLFIITVVGIVIYAILEPYAFLDFPEFWQQTLAQSQMTKDAFTFPYTLQYVGIIPYWYELKNIFLWGLGPLLATISFLGILYGTIVAITKHTRQEKWAQELVILIFFWTYFLTVGKFAIGFMRYMLPLYPLFCLFGAIFICQLITHFIKKTLICNIFYIILFTFFLVWPLSFMHIYSQPNTRVLASNYINQTIPPGKTLAVEHWDDGLPLATQPNYLIQTLALYDQDTSEKWEKIVEQLQHTDYIIIASNRLYVPIQKLADCNKYPQPHCYPIASKYYQNLFDDQPILKGTLLENLPNANNLRFKKISEFTIYPTIPYLHIFINDQKADESFTVYDHPKIMIFKKLNDAK
jgi:hypothetical protein